MIMLPYVFLSWVRRQSESSTFIDLFELTHNIVVVAVKANQKCSYTRRKSKNADLSESVWLQSTIREGPDSLLLVAVFAVKWTQVEV